MIDQGCVSASTFATTALIARMAGLDALGTFTIVWMIVLLVNAGLIIRSFWVLGRDDVGVDTDNLLTMRMELDFSRYRERQARRQFVEQLVQSAQNLPGVEKAGGRIKMEARFTVPLEFPGYVYYWDFDLQVDRPIFIF